MFLTILLILQNLLTPGNTSTAPARESNDVYSDSLSVYVFLADECVISQFFTLELTRLHHAYRSQRVGFIGYFPNAASTTEKIDGFAEKFGIDFPLLQDHTKTWTRKFGITVTPEVAVYDHRDERLLYRGRIDDSYVRVGKRKLHPQHHDLEEIIDQWLLNQSPPDMVKTQAIGCFISFVKPREP